MNKHKKHNFIQGWFPEELKVSSNQQTKGSVPSVARHRFWILLLILGSFAGSFIASLDLVLGWGLFSGLGLYVAVILLVACYTVAVLTAILRNRHPK